MIFFRTYQDQRAFDERRDIIIYTGIHGILKLRDSNWDDPKEIYFNIDGSERFPVPL